MKELHVSVGARAALGITSNGLRLVPKTIVNKIEDADAVQNMTAFVEEDGLLVHTPGAIDFASSTRLSQRHDVWLGTGASAVVVDMFDTRRAQHEGGWPHHSFCGTESRYFRSDIEHICTQQPFFISTTNLADPAAYRVGQAGCATVIAVGPRANSVRQQLRKCADALAAVESGGAIPTGSSLPPLAGGVRMEVSEHECEIEVVTEARIGAQHLEELVRVLHHCLQPLHADLGTIPYRDSLLAAATLVVPELKIDFEGLANPVSAKANWRQQM